MVKKITNLLHSLLEEKYQEVVIYEHNGVLFSDRDCFQYMLHLDQVKDLK